MTLVCDLQLALSATKLSKEHRRICTAMAGELPDPARFKREKYSDDARNQAIAFWQQRTLSEHRSVAVFLLLGAQLIEANATLDAKTVMLKLAQDEFRHTELCAEVLRDLGDEPRITADVEVRPLAIHAGCSLRERALRNVLYTTCLSETIATARLVQALEHTSDDYIRAVTRSIIADEVMHGQFGFLYLEANADWLTANPEIADSLTVYLRHAFAVLESELAPPGMRTMARPSEDAQKLGVIDPRSAIDVFYTTMEHVVVPALELRGIRAEQAWIERTLISGLSRT